MGPEEIPLVHCRCSRRPGWCVCSQPHTLCSERTFKLGWAPPPRPTPRSLGTLVTLPRPLLRRKPLNTHLSKYKPIKTRP